MSRILVAGYYGYGNLGDELILAAMIARLRTERPGLEITAVSAAPSETSARHGVEAAGWFDIQSLVAAAEAADVVVLGGGGLFHDYWGCDPGALLQRTHAGLSQYLGPCLLASLLDKPLMIYAVGVGPLLSEHGRELTRAAFARAAVATVRDDASRALLAEIGVDVARVAVTADPAFDSPVAAAFPAPRGAVTAPIVAVALRSWSHGVLTEYWERQVAEGLDLFLDRRGGEAVFIPFQDAAEPFGDEPVAARVRMLMKQGRHRMLAGTSSPAERLSALDSCDLVLGMRLHALLMGARAGKPLVGLAYDPKVTAALERLDAKESRLDLGSITSTFLADRLDDAWQRRAEVGPRLAANSKTLGARARENASLLLALLDRPPEIPAGDAAGALLKRATLRLAVAADGVHQKAEQEIRLLQARVVEAEGAAQRWETSTAGDIMRLWRRLRR